MAPHHVLNKTSAPERDTQIPSHPDYTLPPQTLLHPPWPICTPCSGHIGLPSSPAWNDLPIFVHLGNSCSLFKRQLRNHLPGEAVPSGIRGSAFPRCSQDPGRAPSRRSPMSVNCVQTLSPRYSVLTLQGKDNVIPVSHPLVPRRMWGVWYVFNQ